MRALRHLVVMLPLLSLIGCADDDVYIPGPDETRPIAPPAEDESIDGDAGGELKQIN